MRAWSVVSFALLSSALIACSGEDISDADSGGGSDVDCESPNGACVVVEAGADATAIQEVLLDVVAGDVVFFSAGTYQLDRGLSLDVDGVTLRGAGIDDTVLSFSGQVEGAQGLLVTGDDFTIEDLAVEDTVGDGIKVEGASGVRFRRVRAEWTGEPSEDNGAYGLYPVQCQDVLVEDSVVRGASDAGIYVGQSENIIVRRNLVEKNVAGIEIENSTGADVFENEATSNTGGVLVFNLPGLPVANGSRTRVFDNRIVSNNWPNFAPEGNIVAKIPPGTGFATIAGHDIEIFGNHFEDNATVNAAVIGFDLTQIEYDDETYDPYSDTIYFHDNTYVGGGEDPTGDLGAILDAIFSGLMDAPVIIPDVVYDGITDPAKSDESGVLTAEFAICVQESGDATFGFLDAANGFAAASLDPAPHDCAHDPLPAITIEGVEP